MADGITSDTTDESGVNDGPFKVHTDGKALRRPSSDRVSSEDISDPQSVRVKVTGRYAAG